jgi:hypothetical protein
MAKEARTRPQDTGIDAFLDAVSPPQRQDEARRLHALFAGVTGFPARVWGGSMVGYGRYAYRYDSGHAGESLATGFAPRKAELVVYILPGYADFAALLADLGPHRLGKSCLYLRRLDGIDMAVLGRLIRAGLDDLATRWTVEPV